MDLEQFLEDHNFRPKVARNCANSRKFQNGNSLKKLKDLDQKLKTSVSDDYPDYTAKWSVDVCKSKKTKNYH